MKLVPLTSVGEIRFDMQAHEYEALLGKPNRVFRRTPDAPSQIHVFDAKRVHLTVDPTNRVTMICAFAPLYVELAGVHLLGREIDSVEQDLSRTSYRFVRNDVGLWCDDAAIGLAEVSDVIKAAEVFARPDRS
jgi:hypothetical protein